MTHWRALRRHMGLLLVATLVAATTSAAVSTWSFGRALTQSARADAPPLVGFSFNPISADFLGDDPRTSLATLLAMLAPDIVRLPIFWERVEPARGAFDYRELDGLLATVRQHNQLVPARPTRVVLVVGARNIGYPEVHIPTWMPLTPSEGLSGVLADTAYSAYFTRSVARYASDSLLAAWQVENEALDDPGSPLAASTSVPVDDLREDIATVHRLDAGTPVIVTTYNSSTLSLDLEKISAPNARRFDVSGATPVGHPQSTTQLADVLGMDAYVATGSTSLADAGVVKRLGWKVAALQYWADEARAAAKPMWITEMQGEPWPGLTNFGPADLLLSAREYRRVGAAAILLWGVEGWLHEPAWMAAGMQARGILGSQVQKGT